MADIRPFSPIRFCDHFSKDMALLTCPPYDVISVDEKQELLSKHPYNAVRLVLPEPPDPYKRAANLLHQWLREGILCKRKEKSLFVYKHEFTSQVTYKKVTRTGIIAAIRLEDFENKIILPHERTHTGPKEDRLQLTIATQTCLEPIFLLHDSKQAQDLLEKAINEATMLYSFSLDDQIHTIWEIPNRDMQQTVINELNKAKFLIADGHHRYETALTYRNLENAKGPNMASNFVMALMVYMNDTGLEVLPVHRAVKKESGIYINTDKRERIELSKVEDALYSSANVVLIQENQAYLIDLKPNGRPEVMALHQDIIDPQLGGKRPEDVFIYTKNISEAIELVSKGKATQGFLLPPIKVQYVMDAAEKGVMMPQKSTYFYPKPASGLFFMALDEEL